MAYRISKIIAHLACLAPLVWLVYGAFNRLLGADPQEKMLHRLGLWTLIFLLLGLSIRPLQQILNFSLLLKFRRMLGLYAAFYLLLHMAIFFYFYLEADVALLWGEVLERPYITVGMFASVLIVPLVVTSTRSMQKRLGRNWKHLHKSVYLISILGVSHFLWQSKSDLNEPLLYIIWLVFLLGYRYFKRRFNIAVKASVK